MRIPRPVGFSLRTVINTCGAVTNPRTLVFVAGIFFAAIVAAQAQESIEPDVLPSLAEPPAASAGASPSVSTESSPALPQSLPSTPAEPAPSARQPAAYAPEPLPSSEQAFPSSPEPLSRSTNYISAQTTVIPPPVASGPYGGTYNVFPGAETAYTSGRPFHYELSLTVRGVWDDNIFISHTNKVSDYYFAIEPVITVGVGDIEGRTRSYLRLDYMPSAILFVDHSDQDAFNQLIHLEGGYNSGRLTLTLTQDIALLESANINSFFDTTGLWANTDASGPTRVNIFYTRLRANYALSPKISLQGEFDSPSYGYPDHISDYTISGGLYVYYNWTPKLSVGIGGTFGYTWVDDPSTDQTFEQVNLRLNYEVTAKLALYASGGVEFRQFDGNRDTYDSPVFEIGVTYHPFSGTNISLSAGRRIYASGYVANQDFGTTYVAGRFQQRLFQRVYFGLGAGYEHSNYFSTDRDVSASRDSDYWFIEPSVDVLITRWLSAGVYYLHREDSSNDDFFSFEDNQVGVRATVRF
ncbi:MAG TPA: outer membrane beta-barrel protein [Candidatus Udaeobacter sp.]|nr:outer membrane beta-barrel protein [Candidatus Udaeobacter sp.]